MNSLKSIAKGGWHPDKSSSSSSSSHRSGDNERFKNFKGLQQVANWTGHGTKSGSQDPSMVTTRPLTSLKDPYSFGAPPKRDPKAPLPPPTQGSVLGGEPAPTVPEPPAQEEETPRPRSFQVNTTGLSTLGLPAPPKRSLGTTSGPSPPLSGRPTPPLPSRSQPPPLPGRQPSNSLSTQGTESPSRSVPTPPSRGTSQASTTSISELSGRFSGLKASSASPSAAPSAETPTSGTTWAQKQAALKTISQARKDPTSVSFSDAAAAAKTADNFRQRHGDQVVKGYRQAEAAGLVDDPVRSKLVEHGTPKDGPQSRWGDATSRFSKASSTYSADVSNTTQGGSSSLGFASIAGKKKPPPPPKPKALETPSSPPPPIPLSTKPK
ncbi:uncharacterized protein DFL_001785 [Arthrobotrys flagrans]|uniref:Uncharacterized protein n=1 Tax=Arthrobotrys flagrans TaxID=97331 RepID=A0A437A8S5_ARTFL|nr:hypothetical protein DFL_001785 [Arthrobotrys flagrans]